MKRIITAVLFLLLMCTLAACNPGGVVAELNDPDNQIKTNISQVTNADEKPDLMFVVSEKTVSHRNISLTIPDNWEYEILKGESDTDYCIAFWPKGETEGRLKLSYCEFFGICGTDLETEDITIGDYNAYTCTYGNDALWEFIIFYDTQGSYVVLNAGAEKWWSRYGEEAMEILSTVKLAEGMVAQ